jgi:hypothetical protein
MKANVELIVICNTVEVARGMEKNVEGSDIPIAIDEIKEKIMDNIMDFDLCGKIKVIINYQGIILMFSEQSVIERKTFHQVFNSMCQAIMKKHEDVTTLLKNGIMPSKISWERK